MTPEELYALVKSVEAPDTVDSLRNGFYTLTIEEMLLLCRKVQAQALRNLKAAFVAGDPRPMNCYVREVQRRINDLERKS